jgi:membrane-bound inhibitor of C-type lysozyme
MNRRKAQLVFGAALLVAGMAAGPLPALAQSFQNYRCADGTHFIAGFYKYDSRAFLQVDGRAVTLTRRLALSGSTYSGSGVRLKITRTGVTLKHTGRPRTACELT